MDIATKLGEILAAINALDKRLSTLEAQDKVGNFTAGSVLFADTNGNVSQDNSKLYWDDTNNRLGIGTNTPGTTLDVLASGTLLRGNVVDSGTANAPTVLTLGHNSTGTPAADFGTATLWTLKTSTTENRNALQLNVQWVVATEGSQTTRSRFFAYDTAARECLRMQSSGSASMLGFNGSAAITKPAVTGSRAGNAALASLLTQLATYGLITDSTTA